MFYADTLLRFAAGYPHKTLPIKRLRCAVRAGILRKKGLQVGFEADFSTFKP